VAGTDRWHTTGRSGFFERSSRVWAFVAAALATTCGGSTDVSSDSGCEHGGKRHDVADHFAAGDGCNTCTCQSDGLVGCTTMACNVGCVHDGNTYLPGESFAVDRCNTCTCEAGGEAVCSFSCPPTGCTFGGMHYAPGESFESEESCQMCACVEDGTQCSLVDCPCTYEGNEFSQGSTFPSRDGCNTCTCAQSSVSCTDLNCPCDPAVEWYRSYVGGSPEECSLIKFACPANTIGFQNECGCGCEQSDACPKVFSYCPPHTPCDVDQLEAECPYSTIAL
jgi:hypothetical protein